MEGTPVETLVFRARNKQFGITISPSLLLELLRHARTTPHLETGGVLVGNYNEPLDHAALTEIVGPPPDSHAWRTGFIRGVRGLATRLRALWDASSRSYYLGEWHFHPLGPATASVDDKQQMARIAADIRYNCPEPILIILGGDPSGQWAIAAYVFTRSGGELQMDQARSAGQYQEHTSHG